MKIASIIWALNFSKNFYIIKGIFKKILELLYLEEEDNGREENF